MYTSSQALIASNFKAAEALIAPIKPLLGPAVATGGQLSRELAAIVRGISHDTDADLFNGYPFSVPALYLWAASVWAFSSTTFQDDELPYPPGSLLTPPTQPVQGCARLTRLAAYARWV